LKSFNIGFAIEAILEVSEQLRDFISQVVKLLLQSLQFSEQILNNLLAHTGLAR
jgi:hypothetical protein